MDKAPKGTKPEQNQNKTSGTKLGKTRGLTAGRFWGRFPGDEQYKQPILRVNTILWIGFGFVVLLIGFLMMVFFVDLKKPHQWEILRFLTALCAGFAGGLLTGTALFSMSGKLGAGEFSISGAAGMALFFTVFFFFGKFSDRPPDALNFSVPDGWTFGAAVEGLVKAKTPVIDFKGFTSAELSIPLQGKTVEGDSLATAIAALRDLGKSPIPAYRLVGKEPLIRVEKIS